MNLSLLNCIPEENVKQWSKLTMYCYDIGCTCSKCEYFPENYKKNCKVKLHVLILCRKFGRPIEVIENEDNGK